MDLCQQSDVSAFKYVMASNMIHSDLEPAKIKCVSVSTFSPSICHKVMGPDTVIFVFWMFSFKPSFSLSSFALIRRLFSFSSLSAIRVVSSAYLRLLMFLLAVLIPACVDPAWHYTWCTLHISQVSRVTVYNLDILFSQFWTSPFPMSGSNCCFMTCIQVSQQVGKVVWYSHLLKNLPVYCDLHKGFSIVSEADVFLKFSCFLMINSACKLNKQGDNIQPWHTLFLIWKQSVVPCPTITVTSWPAYRFLRR